VRSGAFDQLDGDVTQPDRVGSPGAGPLVHGSNRIDMAAQDDAREFEMRTLFT